MKLISSISKISLFLLALQASSLWSAYDNTVLLEKALNNRTPHSESQKDLFKKGNEKGPLTGWFLSNAEINGLIQKLVDTYNGKEVTPPLDSRDQKIIKALKNKLDGYYINEPKLTFERPYKSLLGTYENTPIYKITGWKTYRLLANTEAVADFFRLFLAGAHFVIMGPNTLLQAVKGLSESAPNNKHSHYNETAQSLVFPNITWKTRSPAPIIAALLIDTAKIPNVDSPMTFFQLEGWPVHPGSDLLNDTVLHGKDFLLHRDTLWNVSTYGISPYSEKRGTTVFLTKTPIDPNTAFTFGKKTFATDYNKYADDQRK